MKGIFAGMFIVLITLSFSGCSSEPGSKPWCESMKEKPKGDWSSKDAVMFTKHCVLKNYVE